jgi:hypothetical protein
LLSFAAQVNAAAPQPKVVQRFFGQGGRTTNSFALDGSKTYKFVGAIRDNSGVYGIGITGLFYLYREGENPSGSASTVDFEVRTSPQQNYAENFTFPAGLQSGRYFFDITCGYMWEIRVLEMPEPPSENKEPDNASDEKKFLGLWVEPVTLWESNQMIF